ncbi:GNAT family N-acetyltransferase [Actinomycetaceae bacterium TAE3-ERU4]|nr:GNAT family N-acetyltransferase [Actinomycetaceae bacterium TAE3-ERU4]
MCIELKGEGITLRRTSSEDIEEIAKACSDSRVARWVTTPWPYSFEDAKWFVNSYLDSLPPGSLSLGIYLPESPTLVGVVDLRRQGKMEGEFGCWMLPAFTGRGIMRKAIKMVAQYAFEELGLSRLIWRAEVGNWASRKVAWACGFKYEGVARGAIFPNAYLLAQEEGASNRDLWVLSLLSGESMEPKEKWCGPLEGQLGDIRLPDFNRPEDLVRQFHEVYDCPILDAPTLDTPRLGMRMDLILEEVHELVGAVLGTQSRQIMEEAWRKAKEKDSSERNLVECADALADIIYVVYGMALETGISLPAVLSQVQASNMSKLDADGSVIKREDGKVLKGPNFFRPQVAKILGIDHE